MKKLIYIPIGLLFFACGESNSQEDKEMSENAEFTTNIEDSTSGETALTSSEEVNIEPSGWNVDDYAEFFEDACIVDRQDQIDWNDPDEKCHLFYETKDVKGGFVSIRGGMEGWIEYVMFRMADGRDLVGRMAVGCGPACSYEFKFYYCNKEDYELALEQPFPVEEMDTHIEKMYKKGTEKYPDLEYAEDYQVRYVFPQQGTSMAVNLILGADEIEYPIIKLGWNKTNFFVEELYHEIKEAY